MMRNGMRGIGMCLMVVFGLSATAYAQKQYTAYNMWFEKPERLYAINYKAGNIIPAGTEVKDVQVGSGRKGILRGRPMISFTTVKDGMTYAVEFQGKFHPGLTPEDYAKKMFTDKDFAALTKGMSAAEVEAIKQGKLVVGMSRDAVLVSYGYPPEHVTPSLKNETWTYWMNRFRKKEVYFDKNGRTCRQPVMQNEL